MKVMKAIVTAAMGAGVILLAMGMGTASDLGQELDENCSACHLTKYICQKLDKQDEAAWVSTIKRMNSNGADFPVDKIDAAAAYLVGLKAGDGPLCD
ncbi:hypothetical protein PSDVSF_14780 [Pseudodesulfovibrio sediminis]|uniref:Cytochrome c domain-containing protein n=2 Tax=Pseudodesulfovibrio sediminis TaxID=2810563 RepID=A0ABM7P610_9BACT|nr:hypothetical protein PSDVSF_14780 [Pseudodesulfovibrio sediminis]